MHLSKALLRTQTEKSWISRDFPTEFFTNRVICHALAITTQSQALDPSTMSKLIVYTDTFKEITQAIFGTHDLFFITRKMLDKNILKKKFKDSPAFVTKAAYRIYSECMLNLKANSFFSLEELQTSTMAQILASEIQKMQHDAMKAIYFSVLKDKSLLTSNHLRKINRCLHSNDKKLRHLAKKIISAQRQPFVQSTPTKHHCLGG